MTDENKPATVVAPLEREKLKTLIEELIRLNMYAKDEGEVELQQFTAGAARALGWIEGIEKRTPLQLAGLMMPPCKAKDCKCGAVRQALVDGLIGSELWAKAQ